VIDFICFNGERLPIGFQSDAGDRYNLINNIDVVFTDQPIRSTRQIKISAFTSGKYRNEIVHFKVYNSVEAKIRTDSQRVYNEPLATFSLRGRANDIMHSAVDIKMEAKAVYVEASISHRFIFIFRSRSVVFLRSAPVASPEVQKFIDALEDFEDVDSTIKTLMERPRLEPGFMKAVLQVIDPVKRLGILNLARMLGDRETEEFILRYDTCSKQAPVDSTSERFKRLRSGPSLPIRRRSHIANVPGKGRGVVADVDLPENTIVASYDGRILLDEISKPLTWQGCIKIDYQLNLGFQTAIQTVKVTRPSRLEDGSVRKLHCFDYLAVRPKVIIDADGEPLESVVVTDFDGAPIKVAPGGYVNEDEPDKTNCDLLYRLEKDGIPRAFIITNRHVKRGEELCWFYGSGYVRKGYSIATKGRPSNARLCVNGRIQVLSEKEEDLDEEMRNDVDQATWAAAIQKYAEQLRKKPDMFFIGLYLALWQHEVRKMLFFCSALHVDINCERPSIWINYQGLEVWRWGLIYGLLPNY
jgi:hypothetical protein